MMLVRFFRFPRWGMFRCRPSHRDTVWSCRQTDMTIEHARTTFRLEGLIASHNERTGFDRLTSGSRTQGSLPVRTTQSIRQSVSQSEPFSQSDRHSEPFSQSVRQQSSSQNHSVSQSDTQNHSVNQSDSQSSSQNHSVSQSVRQNHSFSQSDRTIQSVSQTDYSFSQSIISSDRIRNIFIKAILNIQDHSECTCHLCAFR